MSAGMSQAVPLPSDALELLGDYRGALKETRKELKALEKEATRIEKKGGIVTPEMRQAISGARSQRSRLEDRVQAQKIEKANQRTLARTRGSLRRSFTDPIGTAADFGIGRLERTVIGRRLSAAAGSAASKVGGFLSQTGRLGISRAAGLIGSGAVVGATQMAFDVAIERQKVRRRGEAGAGDVEQSFFELTKQAGASGSLGQDLESIQSTARAEGAAAANAVRNGSFFSASQAAFVGDTAAAQDIQDKVAKNSAIRAAKANKLGSGYQDAIDWEQVKRKKATEYRESMYSNLGWADTAINRIGDYARSKSGGAPNSEFVDASSFVMHFVSGGRIMGSGIEKAEALVKEKMISESAAKWEEDRGVLIKPWNDTASVTHAVDRADAHEMQNAIIAYENDRLTRGLTWSF